jgi:hypothetical protein
MSEGKFDPHRKLCPDGGCIGVIGDDGRCRVCGRAAAGGPAPAGFVASGTEDGGEDEDQDETEDRGDGKGEPRVAAAAAGAFDPKRRLCPDGECLGVIGADGVCNVCGKKAD